MENLKIKFKISKQHIYSKYLEVETTQEETKISRYRSHKLCSVASVIDYVIKKHFIVVYNGSTGTPCSTTIPHSWVR